MAKAPNKYYEQPAAGMYRTQRRGERQQKAMEPSERAMLW